MTIRVLALTSLTALSLASHASALERWVYVVNVGDVSIYSVQISDIDSGNWGRDLLGPYVIEPGQEMVVEPDRHRGYCRFDLKVTYETGSEVFLWDVNLCEATEVRTNEYGYTSVAY